MADAITKTERADTISTLVAAGAVAIGVVIATVLRWLDAFTPAGVSVGVPFGGVPTAVVPGEGLPSATVNVTAGDLVALDVNLVSLVCVGASIVIGALAWLAVVALFATLGLRFLRGRFFDAGNARLLIASSWTMLGGGVAVYALETLGRNGVLAATGFGDYTPDSWALAAPFVPIWIAASALALFSIAFRRGIRLQRETDGLV